MIDTDSSRLIGPDESEGLGGGGGRQDLWLASCCQLKRRLKPACPAQTCLIWIPIHTCMYHLDASAPRPPPLHLLCLTTPSSAPLPPANQTIDTNIRIHITHIANKCQHSPRSKWNKQGLPHSSVLPHTHIHTSDFSRLCFNSAALSKASHPPEHRVHHCVNLQLRSFITHVLSCQSFNQ